MKTGVIGLGAMGAPMARNLQKAGLLASVWNRTASKAEALAQELGVAAAQTPRDVAADCDVMIVCVSADNDLLQVVENMLEGLSAGKVVVDTSTVSADTARQVNDKIAATGAQFLDAPVSGGVEGAVHATLSMMIGGEAAALEAARPALEAVSARVTHMGASGAGQATKAVNQIMAAGINHAVTEALAFGEAQELDMEKLVQVVSAGAAGNWFVEHRGPTMINSVFDPGFRMVLHHKDLKICQSMIANMGAESPVVESTLADYETLMVEGHGDDDISGLYRAKRRLFKPEA